MENEKLQSAESRGLDVFRSAENFELAQRVAKSLSSSNLVPDNYKGNIANTLIALEMASRIGASPLMVMQHLYIVYGKPSWSSTFLISAINSSNLFQEPLDFDLTGSGSSLACFAFTTSKSGKVLKSPIVTMAMAKAEGWLDKKGSKWQTMPELMIRYRAASFFSRLFCPHVTMGMQTTEEVIDVTYQEMKSKDLVSDDVANEVKMTTQKINDPESDDISKSIEKDLESLNDQSKIEFENKAKKP